MSMLMLMLVFVDKCASDEKKASQEEKQQCVRGAVCVCVCE